MIISLVQLFAFLMIEARDISLIYYLKVLTSLVYTSLRFFILNNNSVYNLLLFYWTLFNRVYIINQRDFYHKVCFKINNKKSILNCISKNKTTNLKNSNNID